MNLAESQFGNRETQTLAENFVPQSLKVQLPLSLVDHLNANYVGKQVELVRGTFQSVEGVLTGVAEHGGHLALIFSSQIVPYNTVSRIILKDQR